MSSARRLDILFETSLYLILLIPFSMLLFGGAVSIPMSVTFFVVAFASWFLRGSRLSHPENSKWWSAAILIFVAFSGFQLFFTDESILQAGIRLVLVLVLFKLLSRAGARDEQQLYLLSFILLAAATTVNEDLIFGILFGVYVLLGTFSLAVFHLREELKLHPRMVFRNENPLNRQYITVLATISGVILFMSIAIFFTFPRVGMGFFQPQSRSASSMTGFSESVELGGHGVIRTNPEVVMRVEFPDGKAREENFHWRMITFDNYDGVRWRRTLDRKEYRLPRGKRAQRVLDYVFPVKDPVTEMTIYMEPMDTALIPTLWPAKGIKLGAGRIQAPGTKLEFNTPRHGRLTIDLYNDIRHTSESQLGIPYTLWVGTPSETADRTPRKPDKAFLQLPEAFTPRARALAANTVGDAQTNTQKAERLKRFLQAEYDYTLNLPDVGDNPVDGFLFDAKRGHCEYFATSMVMMLRSVDVPARLVNGFLGGQWNPVGGYLAVRQGDAHSWVEYYNPDLGWMPIDPTPANDVPPGNLTLNKLRQYYDAAQLTWMKWIIEYDLAAQIDFLKAAFKMFRPDGLLKGAAQDQGQAAESKPEDTGFQWRLVYLAALLMFAGATFVRTRRRIRRRDRALRLWSTIIGWTVLASATAMFLDGWTVPTALIGASSAIVGASLAWLFRSGQNGQTEAATAFQRIERAVARHGVYREQDQGPAEFLQRLTRLYPSCRPQIHAFSKVYLKARFGGRVPVKSEMDALRQTARDLQSALRRSPKPSVTV